MVLRNGNAIPLTGGLSTFTFAPEGTEKLLAIRENLVQQVNDWSERFTHAELKELDKSLSSVIRILSRINE